MCECKFDIIKCNSDQMWKSDSCRYEYINPKEHHVCKKHIFVFTGINPCSTLFNIFFV